MKRAPGLRQRAGEAARGRRRTARAARRAKRRRTARAAPSRFAAAISPRIRRSATARLDEAVEHLRRRRPTPAHRARARRLRAASAALPAVMQQRGGVEDDDVLLRRAPPSRRAAPSAAPHSRRRRRRSPSSAARARAPHPRARSRAPRSRRPDRRSARVSPCSATSSRPEPWTTSASSTPIASSVCAIRRSIFGSATPSSWTGGRAGLMHGPSRFMIVRTSSCRRTSAGMLHPGMVGGREQEAEAGLVEQRARLVRRDVDLRADRFEHVGRAAARADAAIAVLGDRAARTPRRRRPSRSRR